MAKGRKSGTGEVPASDRMPWAPETNRAVRQADTELGTWLAELDSAVTALRKFAGYSGQPSRFEGMSQWFVPPKGMTLTVTPPAGITLRGGRYSAMDHAMDSPRSNDPQYSEEAPFAGGIALLATLSDELLSDTGIIADLICVQPGLGGEPAVFEDNAPNARFHGDAVFIQHDVRPQTAIAIAGGTAQPIGGEV